MAIPSSTSSSTSSNFKNSIQLFGSDESRPVLIHDCELNFTEIGTLLVADTVDDSCRMGQSGFVSDNLTKVIQDTAIFSSSSNENLTIKGIINRFAIIKNASNNPKQFEVAYSVTSRGLVASIFFNINQRYLCINHLIY